MSFTTKNERRKAARKNGDAKRNREMGRALAEKRWDHHEGVLAPKPRPSDFTITYRPNSVVIPLFVAGRAVPQETEVITDLLKRLGALSK